MSTHRADHFADATADEVEDILRAAPGYRLHLLEVRDAQITRCPVCDDRVIRPHPHAMGAKAS